MGIEKMQVIYFYLKNTDLLILDFCTYVATSLLVVSSNYSVLYAAKSHRSNDDPAAIKISQSSSSASHDFFFTIYNSTPLTLVQWLVSTAQSNSNYRLTRGNFFFPKPCRTYLHLRKLPLHQKRIPQLR